MATPHPNVVAEYAIKHGIKQKEARESLDDSFLVTLNSKKERYANELYRLEKIHSGRKSMKMR